MTDLRQAAQQALEALCSAVEFYWFWIIKGEYRDH